MLTPIKMDSIFKLIWEFRLSLTEEIDKIGKPRVELWSSVNKFLFYCEINLEL